MRVFGCMRCGEGSTLYEWNTHPSRKRLKYNITLHEVYEEEEFKDIRDRLKFTCPKCEQELKIEEIEELF